MYGSSVPAAVVKNAATLPAWQNILPVTGPVMPVKLVTAPLLSIVKVIAVDPPDVSSSVPVHVPEQAEASEIFVIVPRKGLFISMRNP